ncbi:MAG: hypothetical protein JWM19_5692 [Actinomycetia bacterium]|nr:hypothetical protein [Actinomycetes bacterium]
MTMLMVYAGPAAVDAAVTRTGGVPLVPAGFSWPACRTCGGPMQFLAQVMLGDLGLDGWQDVLSVFMCQNDPGLCEEWDPAAGGNQVLLFPPAGLRAAVVPPGPATMLGEASAVQYVAADEEYAEALPVWAAREGRPETDVLGQFGGQPLWVQGDETPACPGCARPMSFAVQLEEGHDYRTAANFGGRGCGYGFACHPCGTSAFLWQC